MGLKTAISAILAIAVFTAVSLATFAATLGLRYAGEISSALSQLPILLNTDKHLPVTTEVFDKDGQKIGEYAGERRYYVRLKDLPEHVTQAFLSAEDHAFYHHGPISVTAMLRSAVVDLRGGRLAQGGSTITQQLARLLFLSAGKTWERKAKEIMLAWAIEQRLSKDQILELYVNKIYLGNGSYGVEAAARNYFRKPATDLSLGEAALLAGIPKSPRRLSPHRHLKAALARQRVVLARMEEDQFLARGDAAAWAKRPVSVAQTREDHWAAAPYFVTATRAELLRKFEFDRLATNGLKIHTTLDRQLQKSAANAVAAAVAATRSTSGGAVEGALITIEPSTGAVLAMQGGERFAASQFNRTAGTKRPVAGLMAPLVASLALQRGYSLDSAIDEDPMGGTRKSVTTNPTPSLREGLLHVAASAIAPLYLTLGDGTMREHLARLGLVFDADLDGGSLALGMGKASPLELAVAYSAFGNGGRLPLPYLVSRVEDRHGKTLYQNRSHQETQQALPKDASLAVWEILSERLKAGARHAEGSAHLAGISTATDDLHDAWFIGALTTGTTVIWLGAEKGQAKVGTSVLAAASRAQGAWESFFAASPAAYRTLALSPTNGKNAQRF